MRETTHARALRRIRSGGPDECWDWTGAVNNRGYGVIRESGHAGRVVLVHRVIADAEFGPLDAGVDVLHRCDRPSCCNPRHLFGGTHRENMEDMAAKGRSAIGRRNGHAKLTDAMVAAARADKSTATRELASAFGVAHQTLSKARTRKTWKHVP